MTLDALFRPRAVAIVGASGDANKVGGRPLAFLLKAGFRGAIYPVNPGAAQVQGVPAFVSLDAVPGPVDQVIVALPASQVAAVVEQCIARGVQALQLFTAGTGLDPATLARARSAGLRVLGPNSLGLFNTAYAFFGTFATALDGAWPRAGGIGVATQSGAFGSYFFGLAQARGLGFSNFIATGNECDVDVAECIAWLARDPATTMIVTAVEGCRDGRRFVAALDDARRAGKPVLAMKVGRSAAGAVAAATHTGSLAGEDRVFDAALRDAGARRLYSLEALVDAAVAAGAGPRPAGRELLVVTTSGGIGVLAADAAEDHGLVLPPIGDAALADVRVIAPLAEGRNPVDTSAGILGDLSAYARIAARALADRRFDAVLCFLAHIARNPAHWAQLREPLYALRARHPDVSFAAVVLADDAVTADLEAHGFAVFADPTRAVAALAACAPGVLPSMQVSGAVDAPNALDDVDPALALDGPLATEVQAKDALARRGIRFTPEAVVQDADGAVAAAAAIGYPVVLKIVSPDIGHKTEAGGVQLGIADEPSLRAALPAMAARVAARAPGARVDGFLVARELRGGTELLIGTQDDPVFGPVLSIGTGGVDAELWRDTALRLAPVTAAQALALLRLTRAGRRCEGWRGAPAADLAAVAEQAALLSRIAWASRGRVAGIDLNPVLARPDGAFALDALIAMAAPAATVPNHPTLGAPA